MVLPDCCVAMAMTAELATVLMPTAPDETLVPGRTLNRPLTLSMPPLLVMSTPAHSDQIAFIPLDELVIEIVAEMSVLVAIFV